MLTIVPKNIPTPLHYYVTLFKSMLIILFGKSPVLYYHYFVATVMDRILFLSLSALYICYFTSYFSLSLFCYLPFLLLPIFLCHRVYITDPVEEEVDPDNIDACNRLKVSIVEFAIFKNNFSEQRK